MSTAHVLTTTRRGALGLGAGLTALGGALAVAGPVLAAPTAAASTRLDTGVGLGSGSVGTQSVVLDQPAVRQASLDAVRALRRRMWGKNPPLLSLDGASGGTVQSYAAQEGYATVDAYADAVVWDQDLERIAVQRLAECIDMGKIQHSRPNGEASSTATIGDIATGTYEILAMTSDTSAGITTGIDMWAGEYDQLVAEGGAWSHATGHLHTLLNPSVTHYGFAASSGYSVGQGLWSRGGSPDSTGWSGTYDITLAGGTDEAPAASAGQTDRPAPSGSGSSSGFQQIIRSFWR